MSSVNLQWLHEGCLRPDPSREKNKANRIRFVLVPTNQPQPAASMAFLVMSKNQIKRLPDKIGLCSPSTSCTSPLYSRILSPPMAPHPHADHLGFLAVSSEHVYSVAQSYLILLGPHGL